MNTSKKEITHKEFQEALEIVKAYKKAKIFKSKELNISYRKINNWDEEGLIPFDLPKNVWHRFNYNEACWVKLIDELREIGLPVPSIRHFNKSISNYSEIIDEKAILFINKHGDFIINYVGDEELKLFNHYIVINIKSIMNEVNDIHAKTIGVFYRVADDYTKKFKIGGNQKLQKIVGECLYYKKGKYWWFNNPKIIEMNICELKKLTKKIENS